MTESEAAQIIAQFIGWIGVIAFLPLLYRFVYALSYYVTGRLKKHQTLIVQHLQDGVIISETEVILDSNSPIAKQLESLRKTIK